jgi:alkylation response protein AidB-like acyl-CoA dehydrogenase
MSTIGLLAAEPSAEQREWLERVERIAPVVTGMRDRAEQERSTPRAVMDALREAGIHRMWVSKDFGGEQVSLHTGMAVLARLARLDSSVAWQMGVQGTVGHLSDYLREDVAAEIFLDNTELVVGGVKPTGRAEQIDGGYLLSGEWSLASGIAHAGWVVCMSVVTRDGQPVMTGAGPEFRALFVPRAKAELLDTWYGIGLRGSGSTHFRVAETFVPEHYTVGRGQMATPPPDRASLAYDLSHFDFGPFTVAPVGLGVAQDALDCIKELATTKVPASSSGTLATSAVAQEWLARIEGQVHTARLLMENAATHAETLGSRGGEGLSALIQLSGSMLAEHTTAAVEGAYRLAGASALYTSSRLERCLRDIHAANQHVATSYTHFETVGDYLLGNALRWRK